MVAEAKFLQAARALQQYASSAEEDTEDDEEEDEVVAPLKRARYAQVIPHSEVRRGSASSGAFVSDPISEKASDRSEEEKPSNIKNVLMAMAEIAAPEPEVPQTEIFAPVPLEKTGSALSLLARSSRPGSTDGNASVSDATISPEGDGVENSVKGSKDAVEPNDMVNFLTTLKER